MTPIIQLSSPFLGGDTSYWPRIAATLVKTRFRSSPTTSSKSVTIAHVHVTEPGASAAEDDEVALSPSEPERRNEMSQHSRCLFANQSAKLTDVHHFY